MGIQIGKKTEIDETVIIRGDTTIGSNNKIGPYVVIGTGPQHAAYDKSNGRIIIGDNNTMHEFITIHGPTGELTKVGSGCYIMAHSNIEHDCIVQDNVIISTRVTLGGHVSIHRHANIGQGADIHPYCRIGSYAMIGMGCPIVKDVPPFALINRGVFTKINRIGLERAGVSSEDIQGIHDAYSGGFEYKNDVWYENEIKLFLNESKKYYRPSF